MLRRTLLALAAATALVAAWFAYTAGAYYLYWSPAEEVSFESGGVRLAGTLVKPARDGRFPAAVMLHGSGPETRSGPGYRAHARALVDAGLAVLIYDKRGAGVSGGDFDAAGYGDFIADAHAALAFLAARDDIDASRIGLVGASESGWFTPEIAAGGDVAWVINKAGPPLDWQETVAWEIRQEMQAEGMPPDEIERQLTLIQRAWVTMVAAATAPGGASEPQAELDAAIAEIRATVPGAEAFLGRLLADYDKGDFTSYAARLAYDPRPHLQTATVPMLYIFAENDASVPSAASLAFLDRLRGDVDAEISTMLLPGVGHTFYSWAGLLTGGYPPHYLPALQTWVKAHI